MASDVTFTFALQVDRPPNGWSSSRVQFITEGIISSLGNILCCILIDSIYY